MNQNKLSFKSENLWVDSISIRSNVFTDEFMEIEFKGT